MARVARRAVLRTGRDRAWREPERGGLAVGVPAHGRRPARAVRRAAGDRRAHGLCRDRRGRRPHARDRPRLRGHRLRGAGAASRRGARVHGDLRGAGRGRLRRPRVGPSRDRRSPRRLAERAPHASHPLAQLRRRRRARRWPTSSSATCTTSAPARSTSRAAARERPSTARSCGPRAPATASRWWGSSRRSRSARCPCSRRSPARPTGSGPSARSRSPSATWPGGASTAC